MVIIASYWELGYDSPLREMERWKFMAKDFGVDKIHMLPVSGISDPLFEDLPDLQAVFDKYPGVPAVFIDEHADTDLGSFMHPEDVIYVFGRTGYSPLALKRETDLGVVIPTPNNLAGMWSHQAATLVLYDRFMKA